MRLGGSGPRPSYSRFNQPRNGKQDKKNSPKCAFCDLAGRPSSHFLSKCHYIPAGDKKFLAKSRRVMIAFEVEKTNQLTRRNLITKIKMSNNTLRSCQEPQELVQSWLSHRHGSMFTTIPFQSQSPLTVEQKQTLFDVMWL